MAELVAQLLKLIKDQVDTTAEPIDGEPGVLGLEYQGRTYFVTVQEG